MTTITPTPGTNAVVAAARDVPELISGLQIEDPALAAQLTGKALAASKSPWGTLIVAVVAWVAARYGLGFDANTDALIAGAGVLVGGFAMRAVTSSPISGWFSAKPIPSATASAVQANLAAASAGAPPIAPVVIKTQ